MGEERNSAGAYKPRRRRAGRGSSSTASPPRTSWRSGRKARCATKWRRPGGWRIRPIPELGESAILKLLDALDAHPRIALPVDEILGPSTLNIGTIGGGRAPNVIPDQAQAEIMIRLVGDSAVTQAALAQAVAGWRNCAKCWRSQRCIWARSTDWKPRWWPTPPISRRSANTWGQPFLFGPGTIHVAHTSEERVPKRQIAGSGRDLSTHGQAITGEELWKQESK